MNVCDLLFHSPEPRFPMTLTLNLSMPERTNSPHTCLQSMFRYLRSRRIIPPTCLQVDSVFNSPGEEEHNHLIKHPEEQVQAERGQESGLHLANKTQMINPVITQQPKLLCSHILLLSSLTKREREMRVLRGRPKEFPGINIWKPASPK